MASQELEPGGESGQRAKQEMKGGDYMKWILAIRFSETLSGGEYGDDCSW